MRPEEPSTDRGRVDSHIRIVPQAVPGINGPEYEPHRKEAGAVFAMEWHDARVFLALTAVGLLVVLPGLLRDGLASTASIDLAAACVLVVAVLLATRTAKPDPLQPHHLVQWIATRGLLYALISTPLVAVIVGFFFALVSYPVASFAVLLGAAILPVWIVLRLQRSTDPTEPVHHLAHYARSALVPVVVFTIVRIPMFYLFGIPYWHPWYGFGNAFTGAPLDQYGSLAAGAILYALQGFALATGFYVLFRKHSLYNAVLYLAVWDVGLYSYVFPLTRLGMDTPFLWHANSVYAHVCMAIAMWGMPYVWTNIWPRLTGRVRAVGWTMLAIVLVLPFGFAVYQATVWQFPLQHTIDRATFDREPIVSLAEGPEVAVDAQEAWYTYRFRFGPRLYRTWAGATRALKAEQLQITGRLLQDGTTIGWCVNDVSSLDGPLIGRDPVAFREALNNMDYTALEVTCVGPAAAAIGSSSPQIQWEATIELLGDRERGNRTITNEN
jgi:hypothetical protein